MAKGRSAAGGWLVAATLTMIILVATGWWNPFPALWDWINTSQTLSDPAPQWQQRLGGRPRTVQAADGIVIVEQPDSVEARDFSTGASRWKAAADWAAVAGPPGRTVVLTGKLLNKGYNILDPRTGRDVRAKDTTALAVWTWSNAMLDVHCRQPDDCVLTRREPASGDVKWEADLPGVGFVLFADNPKLLGARSLTSGQADAQLAPAGLMPTMLGFPVNGRVEVINTDTGAIVTTIQPDRHEKLMVIDDAVLHSRATPASGGCQLQLAATDPYNGHELWHRNGYNLGMVAGAACDQDRDPVLVGKALLATRTDGRQVLLDPHLGRELLVAPVGGSIIASDGVRAVVRSKDGTTLTAYQLGEDDPLFRRKTDPGATAAVTRTGILVFDKHPDRIYLLKDDGSALLESHSDARALSLTQEGLLLGDRRELALLTWPGSRAPVSPSPSPQISGPAGDEHRPRVPGEA
ncbi:hypothetical protein [Hamadaea tsunoensis]|uniref:hypothetical protein n=1 Tax=Hamadaea tsunoensis TaxID=53368 RepID=UPI000683EEC5|nr:hypothetical protein [Hamadaea tsunoensis]